MKKHLLRSILYLFLAFFISRASQSTGEEEMINAASRGDYEKVLALISDNPSLANCIQQSLVDLAWAGTFTMLKDPLSEASKNGHFLTVCALLDNRSAPNGVIPGIVPLVIAAEAGHLNVVEELLAKGASVDLADYQGLTALHKACQKNHIEVAKELLRCGASKYKLDRDKKSPLHYAKGEMKKLLK